MNKNTSLSETFALSSRELETLVAEALRGGGNYCDLYFEHTTISSLMLRDGQVSSGGHHLDYGCGIRVLSGEKTGYAYSESTDMPSLLAAARCAGAIAEGRGTVAPVFGRSAFEEHREDFYPMRNSWKGCDPSLFVPGLLELDSAIRARDSRATKVIAMLGWSLSEVLMYNSFGELCGDLRPSGSLNVSAIYSDGKSTQTKNASRSFRQGTEFFCPQLIGELVREVTTGVDAMFEARRPKGGRMSVVMGAGASGILLHEAMGHAFEADFNRKGQSIFSESMGQRICPEGITIIDDGTITGNRGSNVYDDEGVACQKTVLVEKGILKNYMHDRISAAYYGVNPTGNGRRENFRNNPIPRMRATYMDSGKYSPDEIVESVKYGIYVDEFSNGQVNIGEGDFTFYVKSGHLIENGKLTAPIKDINIIGNGPKALGQISMVGNDLKIDNGSWTCGKDQSVPVSIGIPTVRIDSLSVGGE